MASPALEAKRQAYLLDLASAFAPEVQEVHASLFPRRLPQLASVAYAAVCVGAHQVGGDYYDFFAPGPGRFRFVIGDVCGKGVAAAILRANLQGTLRSLHSFFPDDLEGALNSLNRLFYESTPRRSYSTLFCAEYAEDTRRLRYVNCGHSAPLLWRRDDGFSRLPSTCTVLGLFEEWQCSAAELQLSAGDTLLLYTDGITEARNESGVEFGEERLIHLLRISTGRPVSGMLQGILDAVRQFSAGRQQDDMTLVGLRCGNFPD